jgi:hypothetical protein
MTPDTAAGPSPNPPATAAPPVFVMPVVFVMPAAMRDFLDFDLILAVLEHCRIGLFQFIENSVAFGNSGNRFAWSGQADKRSRPRNAQHSSEKQPTFHQNLQSC